MPSISKIAKEIETNLSELEGATSPPSDYYNSKLRFIGHIKVPLQRACFKKGYSFSSLSQAEQLSTWCALWEHSDCFEVLNQPLFFIDELSKAPTLDFALWRALTPWSEKVENWAHSDSLCGVYAKLLEQFPDKIYPVMERWNTSPHPWLRRISIVSLFYYRRARKEILPYKKVERLVLPLIEDDHFYVQRGVGWTLRELFNAYPEKTLKLLETLAPRLSAIAWYAATEKLTKGDKGRLIRLRG